MRRTFPRLVRNDPVIFMISALLCAAGLVIVLQQRALGALDRQTALIIEKMAEQTTHDVAASIRRTLEAPVFDTLASVKHSYLVRDRPDAERLELLGDLFSQGLQRYPQVERFFVWTAQRHVRARDVLFYGRRGQSPVSRAARPESESFSADPILGEKILETVQRAAASQLIYAASHVEAAGARYDIFTRVYYTDADRTTYFAVTGYLVNLDSVRRDLLAVLVERGLGKRLDPADGTPAFEMRVLDERGQLVFGPSGPASRPSAEAQIDLQFYPEDDIQTRMATKAPKRTWTIIVSQRNGQSPVLVGSMRPQTYWLSALSVLLIGAALGFALQARGRAAQLSRMQTDFVAHVSHQLKTPVSLLSAVTETVDLVRGRAPEKLDQCLDIIKVETARLSSLVQHILEFSSISEGRRRLELEPVALASLVRETVESFASALAPTGFHIEVHERGAPTVAADPVALEQALVNLLDNAIKYSGESRQIEVRVRSEATHACIEIIDRGIGVDPRDQARIFERFYRGSHGASNRQGFGLGLAIARQLVEGQRGIIQLKSEPRVGSTFTIRLPLLRPESAIEARVDTARSFSKRTTACISDVRAGKEPA